MSKGAANWTRQQAEDYARKHAGKPAAIAIANALKTPGKSPTLPQDCVLGPKGGDMPGKPPKAKKPREPNKTEREFGLILQKRFPDCEVTWEKYTFLLAPGCRYTPDWCVTNRHGILMFFEVKGAFLFKGAHASALTATLTKPKVAAEMFRHRFVIAQKIDGAWHETPLPGKIDT
jgi:hypothetical protein